MSARARDISRPALLIVDTGSDGVRGLDPLQAAGRPVTTIFIVDDDCSVNLAVSRLLETSGFGVRSFTSAGALLADENALNADCLVLDIHLPDMNGFDLQRRLASLGSTTPVVVITAHDDAMHRRAARDVGAFAYLTKPFSSLSLVDVVSRAVAARR
jgi:FixJ family two-component response regulator